MPVVVRTVAGKFRIVDVESGRITPNAKGDGFVDQGGGASQSKQVELERQSRAINARLTAKRADTVASKLEAREAARVVTRRLKAAKNKKKPKGYKRGKR